MWLARLPAVSGFLLGGGCAVFFVLIKFYVVAKPPPKYLRDTELLKEPLVPLAPPKKSD